MIKHTDEYRQMSINIAKIWQSRDYLPCIVSTIADFFDNMGFFKASINLLAMTTKMNFVDRSYLIFGSIYSWIGCAVINICSISNILTVMK